MGQPLSPETLVYDLTTAGEPQVSPDGTRIIYTLSKIDRESKQADSQVWLRDVDGGNPRRLTWSGERNTGARWSPDGQQIAFVSNRVAGGNRKSKQTGLFVLPTDGGGEARELTRHNGSIGDLAWSPEGARIAYTTLYDPENPDESDLPEGAPPKVRVTRRIDYKQDNRGYLHDTRLQVFVVDVASGEHQRLTDDLFDHNSPQWSPDGKWLAAQRPNHNGMQSQLLVIPADRSGEPVLIGPEEGVVGVWAWSPSGDRIIFAGDTRQTYQTDFFVYTLATGELRRLTDDLQALPDAGFPTIAPPAQPVWLDDRRVLFHAIRAGGSVLQVIDSETGSVESLKNWQALHAGLSAGAAGRRVAQARTSLDSFGEIIVTDTQADQSQVITSYNADLLRDHPPAQSERIDVRRGDFTIEAWLLKPPDFDPGKRYPVILDVHGGPNGFYGYAFNLTQQCFATNGFLVVFANPRGSGSYGRDFTQQVLRDWGGEDFQDLLAVIDEVLRRPYADPDRTGIYGYSYGGYMTSWTIGQTDRFKAAVCGAPCFDLESFYGTSDIGHTFGKNQFGGPPHEQQEWYAAHSPSTFAHRAKTPTLIVHGEADERCPIGQGEQMFIALLEAGCEVEFARYPGGSHLMLRGGPPEHRKDYLARTLAWFKDHLGEPA